MQTLIHTDHTIHGSEERTAHITAVVEGALHHFSDHITRVEVHLRDENSKKSGTNDIRCLMEARLEGRQPFVATHHASDLEEAVGGAADKLAKLVEKAHGKKLDLRKHLAV